MLLVSCIFFVAGNFSTVFKILHRADDRNRTTSIISDAQLRLEKLG